MNKNLLQIYKLYNIETFYHLQKLKTNLALISQNINCLRDKLKSYKYIYLLENDIIFDIIYLDGCHEPEYIKRDIENVFKFTKKDSIIWFDDYGGGVNGSIKKNINNFLQKYKNKFKILYIGYQLGIQIL